MSNSPTRSASGNELDEDSLFPQYNNPRTPVSSQPAQAFDSPPETQADAAQAKKNAEKASMIPTRGISFTTGAKQTTEGDFRSGTTTNPASKHYPPGEIWRNPSAVESLQKAMENVLDKSFSLKKFGDIFDESNMK